MIRPNITLAMSQCACFCNNPQKEHEEAVKQVCRYLLCTKTKGLILKADQTCGLKCHVDANWAGSWHQYSAHDPLSSHNQTGYIITYAGCPIIWTSKLQP